MKTSQNLLLMLPFTAAASLTAQTKNSQSYNSPGDTNLNERC
ncbi:MAG: hypothetical protein ACJA1Z_001447 [Patiriisocius sp.]|jgi:hypothetical protein